MNFGGEIGAYGSTPVHRSGTLPSGRIFTGVDPSGRGLSTALVAGDADRFADSHAERVRRQAVAEAVETVRAGLRHLVPRDRTRELLADLLRPTVKGDPW